DVKKSAKLSDLPNDVIPIIVVEDGKLNPYFSKNTVLRPGQTLILLGNPDRFKDITRLLE
ncbi:MAG: potassium transporter TrkA, partial [Metallosphaera sp.]